MAHDGTGTGWDETAPAGTDAISYGDNEIRDLRKAVRIRVEYEHTTPAGSSAGGVHKEGAARAYYQAAAPKQRPDAATNLGASDDGRLWVDSDDDSLLVWNGSAFTDVTAFGGSVSTGDIDADAIDKTLINADIAGDGLVQAAGGELDVNVDDSTIEIDTDVVRVKDGGITAAKLATAGAVNLYAVVWDQKSTGTDGGTFTQDAWQTRNVNQVRVQDTDGSPTGGSWCAVASNQITLAAGSYIVNGQVPCMEVDLHQARLYDTTGAAVLVLGSSGDAGSAAPKNVSSFLQGGFTLAGESVVEIQHYCSDTKADNGFGIAGDTGLSEVYSTLQIIKIG